MARAGTAFIEVQGDFRHLNRQINQVANQGGRKLGRGLSSGTNNATRSNSRYSRSLNQVSRSTATASKHAEHHGRALREVGHGAAYALGAGGFGGGLFAVFEVLRRSIDKWHEAEQVTKLTGAVLRSTGGAANVTAKHVEELSRSIERKTAVDHLTIQASENLLLTFPKIRNEAGQNNKIFDQAAVAALNLATALNHGAAPSVDKLHSSTLQLGKALQDPERGMTALRRVGVGFTKDQQDQIKTLVKSGHQLEAQKLILREISKEFGGAAAKTATPSRRLQTNLNDITEALGKGVTPTLNKGATALNKFLRQMQTGHGAGGRFANDLKDIWQAAKPVVVFIGRAALGIGRFAAHHKDLTKMAIELALIGKIIKGIQGSRTLAGLGALAGGGARRQGAQAGGELASGLEAGLAGGAVGGRLTRSLSRLAPFARKAGRLGLGVALINGLTEAVSHGDKTFGQKLQRFVSGATLGVFPAPRDVDQRMKTIVARIQTWRGRALALNRRGDPGASIIRRKDLKDFDQGQLHMIRGMAKLRNVANRTLGPGARLPTKAWLNPGPVTRDLTTLSRGFNRLRSNVSGSTNRIRQDSDRNFKLIARSVGINSRDGYNAAKKNFDLTATAIKNAVHQGWLRADKGSRDILHAFRVNFRASAVATQHGMGDAKKAIQNAVHSGIITSKQGTAEISRLFRKYLAQFGIKGHLADVYLHPSHALAHTPGFSGSVGQGVGIGRQTGGMVVPGTGSGDKVPLHAMVEPGEEVFVLNRNAARKRQQLEMLNQAVPRFQRGGGMQAGGSLGGLHQGIANLVRAVLGRWPGLAVTATTGGNHVAGSYHYRGMAADLASGNYTYMNQAAAWVRNHFGRSLTEGIHNPNLAISDGHPVSGPSFYGAVWAGHRNHIHLAVAGALKALGLAGGAGGVTAPHIARMLVGGPDTPIKGIVQRGLDTARTLSQTRLNQVASLMGGDAAAPPAKGHYSKGQLKALWIRAGGNPAMANLMAAIALAESGGDPGAGRTHPYHGLWQVGPGGSFDPFTNAKQAVGKLASQGLGAWETYTNGAYRSFLQRGGLLKQGGGWLGNLIAGTASRHHHRHRHHRPHHKSKLQKMLDRVDRFGGISKGTKNKIARLIGSASRYGEFADEAANIRDDGKGVFRGQTEITWLHEQLRDLLLLRNTIIKAYRHLEHLKKRLRHLMAHPGRHLTRRQRHGIRTHARKRIKALSGMQSDLLSRDGGLTELQGDFGPMRVYSRLPGIGTFGGTMGEIMIKLRDFAKPADATDASATTTDTSERVGLLQQELAEANLRTALLQRQFATLRGAGDLFGGSFAEGGVVAGPKGARRIIEAHGQEVIFTPEQAAAMGGGDVHIHVDPAMAFLKNFIRVERDRAPVARRVLPGARG